MKQVYIILGEGGSGKSTTIRALTGIRVMNRYWVRPVSGPDMMLWSYMRAAQEMNMSPSQIVNDITNPAEAAYTYYLVPLRINPVNGLPDGDAYIQALLAAGCNIAGIAVMGTSIGKVPFALPTAPTVAISSSATAPPNANAHVIRNCWRWL